MKKMKIILTMIYSIGSAFLLILPLGHLVYKKVSMLFDYDTVILFTVISTFIISALVFYGIFSLIVDKICLKKVNKIIVGILIFILFCILTIIIYYWAGGYIFTYIPYSDVFYIDNEINKYLIF